MVSREKGGEHKRTGVPWWQRLARPWRLLVGVATVVGTVVAVIAVLSPNSSSLTADEVRLEALRPPALATNCRPYDPGGDPSYDGLSIADLKCKPLGKGSDTVKFHLFTNKGDLKKFMKLERDYLEYSRDGCTSSGFPYASPWVDRDGKIRGELLCADDNEESKLVWSYPDRLVAASAASQPSAVIRFHSWWQRRVKFGGGVPSMEARQHLREVLPAAFRECQPMSLLAPAALAGISCEPGDGIGVAGAELFAGRKLLSAYMDFVANRDGIDDEGCRQSPLSYTSYGLPPDYKPALGYLLCRPESGVEWFEWTALNPLVYAYASRTDSNFEELYEQWSQSLSLI
jgi:hypothetical protein